jgi:hypothetical protein
MCFSPEADFAAAAVVGVVGVATLRRVRKRRELIVGALPLLFAVHQFLEGFVWLGLRGDVSTGLGNAARDAYLLYAFAVLPMIVPVGFLLLEPVRRRRHWVLPFVALGAGVGLYLLWEVARYPVDAVAHPDGIAYYTHAGDGYVPAVAYIVATCGPALLSSLSYLRWFGVINVAGAVVAAAVYQLEFESIWCLYAALASTLIFEHFRRRRSAKKVQLGYAGTA